MEYRLECKKIIEYSCEINHLSNIEHVSYWQQALLDWGKKVAETNVIGKIRNHEVEMYPLDHSYPHVHLIDPQLFVFKGRRKTVAKYRIDRFERMEGPPHWDNDMRSWIEKYRDQLLRSWNRCKNGGHPYRIMEDDE